MATFGIGVVAASLSAGEPASTVRAAVRVGAAGVQIPARPPAGLSNRQWADTWLAAVEGTSVRIFSGMTGFAHEDYHTLEAIRRTGGLVPDEFAEAAVASVIAAAELTRRVGVDLLTLHAGFIPDSQDDPTYPKLLDRIGRIADAAAGLGVRVGLESGQESAPTLKRFINHLARPNIGCNFDPANMILYGRQEPVEAVDILKDHIFQVHGKDALWSQEPKVTWGKEVPLGDGDVDWPRFAAKLVDAGFAGNIVIEREVGPDPQADVAQAVARLHRMG